MTHILPWGRRIQVKGGSVPTQGDRVVQGGYSVDIPSLYTLHVLTSHQLIDIQPKPRSKPAFLWQGVDTC